VRKKTYITIFACLLASDWALAQTSVGTAFSYQGQLRQSGTLANGSFDMEFVLFDNSDPNQGTALGTVSLNGVDVSQGLFSVDLDFGGSAFADQARWLQIKVAPAGSGIFTALDPLQRLTPSPFAIATRPRDCVSGFVAVNRNYCIETDERSGVSFWNAAVTCMDADARLCTLAEWHYACQRSGLGLSGMTSGWEWVDDGNNTSDRVQTMGNGSCITHSTEVATVSVPFRCCLPR
jgi:hypothetical protein